MIDYSLFKHVFNSAMQGKAIQVDVGPEWKDVTLSEAVALMNSKKPEQFRAKLEFVKIGEQTVSAPVTEETDFFIDVDGYKASKLTGASMSFRLFFSSAEHLHYAHTALRNLFGDKALVG